MQTKREKRNMKLKPGKKEVGGLCTFLKQIMVGIKSL